MTETEKMKNPNTDPSQTAPGTAQISQQSTTSVSTQRPTPLSRVDTSAMEQNIRDINDAAAKQHQMSIDNAMRQEADAMRLAEREAAAQYAEQRRQTDLAERQALDNSALYAEARGDRGGVGQAQYNAIQATSAKNRADIQQAQTKMASEVTRQIAQMRRQGEYKKADALLSLSQQYLSQLNDLKRWETESNMSVEQANNALAQWQMNFEQAAKQADLEKAIAEAGLTGMYNGQQTLAARQAEQQAALAQREFELNKALSEAGLTGMYNGQQTLAAQQAALEKALAEAGLTGMYNGQQTLAAQQFAADQKYRADQMAMAQQEFNLNKALSEAGLTGMYNGQQTLAAQQAALEKALAEAGLTGMYNGQQTLAAQQAAADQAYRDKQLAMAQQEFDLNKALSEAGLTGMYNGQRTLAAQQAAADQAYREQQMALAQQEFAYNQNRDSVQDAQTAAKNTANQGWSVLELGVMPSAEQLSAMGMSTAQAQQYLTEAKALADATAQAQRIGDNSKVAALGWTSLEAGIVPSAEQLAAMGVSAADAQAYINRNRQDIVIGSSAVGSGNVSGNGSSAVSSVGGSSAVGSGQTASNPGAPTSDKDTLSSAGFDALNAGRLPSDDQLAAMGWTKANAQAYIDGKKRVGMANEAYKQSQTQTSAPSRTDSNGNVMQAVNADQMLPNTQSNKPISPSTPSTLTGNQSKVDQVYQNALNQYRVNGSLPTLTSLVNRGLTTSEAQSVLDRLKTPAATQTTQQRNSMGVADADGTFISATDPRVASIRTDSNGNTVYTLTDGRVLTDYTSRGTSTTAPTGSQTTAPGGRTGSTNAVNADQLNALNNLLKKLY